MGTQRLLVHLRNSSIQTQFAREKDDSMSGSNAAQDDEREPPGPIMNAWNHTDQNGPGDMYLALKRMLVGDGKNRACSKKAVSK